MLSIQRLAAVLLSDKHSGNGLPYTRSYPLFTVILVNSPALGQKQNHLVGICVQEEMREKKKATARDTVLSFRIFSIQTRPTLANGVIVVLSILVSVALLVLETSLKRHYKQSLLGYQASHWVWVHGAGMEVELQGWPSAPQPPQPPQSPQPPQPSNHGRLRGRC